jgi:hypothetical protein
VSCRIRSAEIMMGDAANHPNHAVLVHQDEPEAWWYPVQTQQDLNKAMAIYVKREARGHAAVVSRRLRSAC